MLDGKLNDIEMTLARQEEKQNYKADSLKEQLNIFELKLKQID